MELACTTDAVADDTFSDETFTEKQLNVFLKG
jgi:hypothetical protein